MHRAWIVATGTELTLGHRLNTNAAWLASRLAAVGIRTVRHVVVPDDLGSMREVLLQAADNCEIILITGGLGPTTDDVTRPALAEAVGVPLELHLPSLEHVRGFFAARDRPMPDCNRGQALLPRSATALPNTCGIAPGIFIRIKNAACYALPGVPLEMQAMFEREVLPRLRAAGEQGALLTRMLRTFGLGESEIQERIGDLMEANRNPEVGTAADLGLVSIRISAAGPTSSAAQSLLDQAEAELRRRLGEAVFGRDQETLASVIGSLLTTAGLTLGTAESCTGGMIGSLLTDVPGSSRYYRGGIIAYANAAKVSLLGVPAATLERDGAVSGSVAAAMAEGVAERLETDFGIGITGVAGPTGGSPGKPVGLVFIAIHARDGTVAQEFRFGQDWPREAIRIRAARTALNLLRHRLLRHLYGSSADGR